MYIYPCVRAYMCVLNRATRFRGFRFTSVFNTLRHKNSLPYLQVTTAITTMVTTKKKPEYTVIDPNAKPLPKHGHLSEPDPAFASLKPELDQMMNAVWTPSLSLDKFREVWLTETPVPLSFPQEGRDVVTEVGKIPMRDGHKVSAKIYRRKERQRSGKSALVMRFHGGGWVVGGHCTEHAESLLIAGRTDCVVVSVEYRKAPEYKFPYAPNDCFDATKWCKDNALKLTVDAENIVLIGGSAGANLAAVVAIMARDEGITGIVGQALNFPATVHPKFAPTDKYELCSYAQNHDASVVDAVRMEWFLDHYMPEPTDDWRLSCLLTPSLKNLPPAHIVIAGADVLRDEGLAYAQRLEEEGNEVEVLVGPGLPHCYYSLFGHPKSGEYYERVLGFIERFAPAPLERL